MGASPIPPVADQDRTTRTVLVGPRPDRIATLVRSDETDWQHVCLTIIDWYSQIWGGRANVIVPVSQDGMDARFLTLLREYDPDTLHLYQKTLADLQTAQPRKFELAIAQARKEYLEAQGSEDDLDEFIRTTVVTCETDSFKLDGNFEKDLLRKLNPFPRGGIIGIDKNNQGGFHSLLVDILPYWKDEPPLVAAVEVDADVDTRLLVSSAQGSTAGLHRALVDSRRRLEAAARGKSPVIDDREARRRLWALARMQVGTLGKAKSAQSDQLHELAWKCNLDLGTRELLSCVGLKMPGSMETPFSPPRAPMVPFHAGDLGLTAYSSDSETEKAGAVAVLGAGFADFCGFTLLRGLFRRVIWLPADAEDALLGLVKRADRSLSSVAALRWYPRIVLTSFTLHKDRVTSLVKQANSMPHGRLHYAYRDPKSTGLAPRFSLETGTTDEIEHFKGSVSERIIPTPVPRSFEPSMDVYWVGDCGMGNWAVPRRRAMAKGILHDYTSDVAEQVRVTRRGFATQSVGSLVQGRVVEYNIRRSRIKVPSAWEALSAMLRDAGLHVWLSNKGSYMRQAVSMLGSLGAAAAFCADDRRFNLVRTCLNQKGNLPDAEHMGLELAPAKVMGRKRRYLTFASIAEQLNDEAESFVDQMCEAKVLHRGYALKCGDCHRAEWYALAEVGPGFQCRFCGSMQPLSKEQRGPHPDASADVAVCYRLDELVHQGFDQNIEVPILTLEALKGSTRSGFDYTAEVCCSSKSGDRHPIELDICAVVGGDMVLGECTATGKLAKNVADLRGRAKRWASVAGALAVEEYVFATTAASWPQATQDTIQEVFSDVHCGISWLVSQDLLPGKNK